MDTFKEDGFLDTFLRESRASFSLSLDHDLVIYSVSRGYFFGLYDSTHDPVGSPITELVGGASRLPDKLRGISGRAGEVMPVRLNLLFPFPQPRNVRGVALGMEGGVLLLLERETDPPGKEMDAGGMSFKSQAAIHRDLCATQEELSRLRKDLGEATGKLGLLESMSMMQSMIIPLIEQVAESAKTISSLAVILATRMDDGDSENIEILLRLEDEGVRLHESASRLGRGLL